MDNNQSTPYQEQIANLYAEASANKYKFTEDFKKKFYPVDPFDGAWVSVCEIPIEIFLIAAQAEKELDDNLSCWLDVFDPSLSDIAVKINVGWLNKRRKHSQLIHNYVTCVVRGNLTGAATARAAIVEIDDFQIRKDLTEADAALFPAASNSEVTVNVEGMEDEQD